MAAQEYLIIEHLTIKEITRFFSQVKINKATDCWEWTGSTVGKGYGYAYLAQEQRHEYAHRMMYAWLVGPIPRGRRRNIPVLDHFVCDNPRCCNPIHLKLAPQRNNVLRGSSLAADNTRKTHCPKGHLLPLEPNQLSGYTRNREPKLCRRCKVCQTEKYQAMISGPDREKYLEYHRTMQRRYTARKRSKAVPTTPQLICGPDK